MFPIHPIFFCIIAGIIVISLLVVAFKANDTRINKINEAHELGLYYDKDGFLRSEIPEVEDVYYLDDLSERIKSYLENRFESHFAKYCKKHNITHNSAEDFLIECKKYKDSILKILSNSDPFLVFEIYHRLIWDENIPWVVARLLQ